MNANMRGEKKGVKKLAKVASMKQKELSNFINTYENWEKEGNV